MRDDISLNASAHLEMESVISATLYPISLKYSAIVAPIKIDASLAATGIFDVFTIRTVLRLKGRPVDGSNSFGNSVKTSVISFPRSPHPTYTIISDFAYLA